MSEKHEAICAALSVIGVGAGFYSLILGLSSSAQALQMDKGNLESFSTYGGDAYTGIQNAAAQTANNVYYGNDILCGLGEILRGLSDVIAGLMIVVGLGMIAGFGIMLVKSIRAYSQKAKNEKSRQAVDGESAMRDTGKGGEPTEDDGTSAETAKREEAEEKAE